MEVNIDTSHFLTSVFSFEKHNNSNKDLLKH